MQASNAKKLTQHLKPGHVYRRDMLTTHSSALDRELAVLVKNSELEKLAGGLYYRPKFSRFGPLPPNDKTLVQAFLKDTQFLIVSWSDFNALGLGFTQLYNRLVVYNFKRHGVFQLGDKSFDFRRPNYGFPKKLTEAFLLVDLFNHLNELNEDVNKIKHNISLLNPDLLNNATHLAQKYGKVGTKKFFKGLVTK